MTRVLFLGSKPVGLRCLRALHASDDVSLVGAVTIDDRADVRSAHQDIVAFCREANVRLHEPATRADLPGIIRELAPDLCIVVGWYWLLPRELLESVPRGFVGLHFSALPKYRGSSPLVWALINGEREIGISLFALADDMDAGDIWGQALLPVGEGEYVGTVLARLEDAAVTLLQATLPTLDAASARPTPQVHADATFCALRRPEDGLISWDWPATRVFDFIRAQSRPYPGAFSYLGTERVTIWRVSRFAHDYHGAPGQVVRNPDGGQMVVCGDHRALILDDVTFAGPASALHGARLGSGHPS